VGMMDGVIAGAAVVSVVIGIVSWQVGVSTLKTAEAGTTNLDARLQEDEIHLTSWPTGVRLKELNLLVGCSTSPCKGDFENAVRLWIPADSRVIDEGLSVKIPIASAIKSDLKDPATSLHLGVQFAAQSRAKHFRSIEVKR